MGISRLMTERRKVRKLATMVKHDVFFTYPSEPMLTAIFLRDKHWGGEMLVDRSRSPGIKHNLYQAIQEGPAIVRQVK